MDLDAIMAALPGRRFDELPADVQRECDAWIERTAMSLADFVASYRSQ